MESSGSRRGVSALVHSVVLLAAAMQAWAGRGRC